MAQMPMKLSESSLVSSSGTVLADLWTFVGTLTETQKDHLAIDVNITLSGSTYTVLVRRSLAGVYEGYNSSYGSDNTKRAITVYCLQTTQLLVRNYPQQGDATQAVATVNSWSASAPRV